MTLDLYPYTTNHRTSTAIPTPQSSNSKGNVKSPPPQNTNHNINSPANSLPYELAGVIVHKGKLDSGHYVSYSREGDDWFMFDDSKVVLVSEADVLAAEAYLLFYMVGSLDI